jgi:hypothetical protein
VFSGFSHLAILIAAAAHDAASAQRPALRRSGATDFPPDRRAVRISSRRCGEAGGGGTERTTSTSDAISCHLGPQSAQPPA